MRGPVFSCLHRTGWNCWISERAPKGLVTNYGEGGGGVLQNGRVGGGHVKFYLYKKGGRKKF